MNNPLEHVIPTQDSITKHFTLHELDLSFFGEDICKAISLLAAQNEVSQDTVFFCMLPVISTALGMHTYINSGTRKDIKTKPNTFCINILPSASGKSPIASSIINPTLYPLHDMLQKKNDEQMASLKINKTDGPIHNSTDLAAEKTKVSLSRHSVVMSHGSPEAIFHYAGNGASLLFFDEIAAFWKQFNGKDRNLQMLTELYQSHRAEKLLIGRTSTSVPDSSLSLYAHGTPEFGAHFFDPDVRSDGSTWRFWINIDIPELNTLSYSEYVATKSLDSPNLQCFYELFDKIRKVHFQNTSDKIYNYTPLALCYKQNIENAIMWLSSSIQNSSMTTMLKKLLAVFDKSALIHSIIISHLDRDDTFMRTHSHSVDLESAEFAWSMACKVWTGWMSMLQDDSTNPQSFDELKKSTVKKPTRDMKEFNEILKCMGGPKTYHHSVFKDAVDNHSFVGINQSRAKSQLYAMLLKLPNIAIFNGDKVTLKYI